MVNNIPVSVLIYTKNEQQDLPGCLASLAWCDDIHVVDSMSDDATVELATRAGATVTQRSYPDTTLAFGGDEAGHRNWAMTHVPFRHAWVYHSDADERVTADLAKAISRAVAAPDGCAGFRVQRRDYFQGRWLKHCTPSPFNIRLFRADKVRYERLTNPVTVIDGPVGELNAHFDHYPFSKGMRHWVAKHNQYSDFEAAQIVRNRVEGTGFSIRRAFFAADLNVRRAQQKELFYRLPMRPLVMFLLLYVVRRGFLDGKAGFRFALLRALYEYMIVIKTEELIGQGAEKGVG